MYNILYIWDIHSKKFQKIEELLDKVTLYFEVLHMYVYI